ncbi:2-phosphosulfolactate phosphatase [Gaoshiqia sediminis]|uniref:Probable 2-phosphosulfolactate phosphatase n=1 Tax=Gaoshiqia sediminis TaxID=2986998 RepID=A0AA42C750_9BACT|nr:2-phosphosulfolactate phosphatase [Gaoshiqia sediminis]MCW0483229.1 2-phosphosulfolactate phosphatase [Gaoshiqia sediminis]
MEIQILQLLNGARQAEGLTVIIDVFRAFSVACYAYQNGVRRIYPVGDIEQAYRLKEENPDFILVGERNEKKPEGFDFGNSPSQLLTGRLDGKTMVHTTSSGTQGIANATRADGIITGSFVNAGAIIRYIEKQQPEKLSLVCMGYACSYPTDEDTFLAEYLKAKLEGQPVDFEAMVEILRAGAGARFFAPEKQEWAPAADFDLCLSLNRFDFVLKVEQEEGRNYLRKIDC